MDLSVQNRTAVFDFNTYPSFFFNLDTELTIQKKDLKYWSSDVSILVLRAEMRQKYLMF